MVDKEKQWDRELVINNICVILGVGYDIVTYTELQDRRKRMVHQQCVWRRRRW